MKEIIVVAALIKKEDKILIAKRSTGDKNVLGEEFELKIKAEKYITNNICNYPTKIVDLRLYRCKYISGDFKLHDHSEYVWVDANNILDYDLAPADIPLAKYIKENNL